MALKKYDSYKSCVIRTASDEFQQIFTNDWSFTDIRQWMLDTYCIDENSIIEIQISSVTLYKLPKND
jgi:hypothetical protein